MSWSSRDEAGSHRLYWTEERLIGSSISLSNSDDNQMRFFASQTVASPKLKEVLTQAAQMKFGIQKTQREIQEQQRQLNVITQDQVRLRANLKEMPPTAAADTCLGACYEFSQSSPRSR